MKLIKDNVNDVLNSLVGDMFAMNRLLDRQMSILSVKFVMPNLSKILHQKYAHAMPLEADKISDYQGSRNCMTIYPETPIGDEDYNSPIELFTRMLEKQLEIEENICEAMNSAYEDGDMSTKVFLQEFLRGFKKYAEQSLILVDKATMYGDILKHWMDFDHDAEKFIVL